MVPWAAGCIAWRAASPCRSSPTPRDDAIGNDGPPNWPARASPSSPPWDDRDAILHEEIDRLPERYRQPIVLCYLEEMTYQQAANQLRWSEGSTQGRLRQGQGSAEGPANPARRDFGRRGPECPDHPQDHSGGLDGDAPGDRPGRASFCPGRGRRGRNGLDGNDRPW